MIGPHTLLLPPFRHLSSSFLPPFRHLFPSFFHPSDPNPRPRPSLIPPSARPVSLSFRPEGDPNVTHARPAFLPPARRLFSSDFRPEFGPKQARVRPRTGPVSPRFRRLLALALAAAMMVGLVGCGEGKIKGEQLSKELSDALGWSWIENPTKAAVDMGLLSQQEAEEGITAEGLIEIRKTVEKRKKGETFLHGFYAGGSYGQIDLAKEMDSVSFGWAKIDMDEEAELFLNQSAENGNGWYVPAGSQVAVDYMEENRVEYNLCVFGSSGDAKDWTDPKRREKGIELLAAAAEAYGGLTIDFEGLRGEENKENFTVFMEKLRKALPSDKKLYVCVQPLTWFNGYDYRALGEVCDKVILMAHDYQWLSVPEENLGTNRTETPVAPLNHVYNALRDITDGERGVTEREKIVLAISFGSCGVEIDENGLLCSKKLFAPTVETLEKRLGQEEAEVTFHERYQSPFVTYQNEEGRWFKVWFENEESVRAKVALARLFGVSGVSVWRLGSIPNGENYNAWNGLLREMGR